MQPYILNILLAKNLQSQNNFVGPLQATWLRIPIIDIPKINYIFLIACAQAAGALDYVHCSRANKSITDLILRESVCVCVCMLCRWGYQAKKLNLQYLST